eukprot:1151086-Pelagomonas_calceolata.AAC.2
MVPTSCQRCTCNIHPPYTIPKFMCLDLPHHVLRNTARFRLQLRAPASAGFVVPECFECRPECSSWCVNLTLPILFENVCGTVHNRSTLNQQNHTHVLSLLAKTRLCSTSLFLARQQCLANINAYQPTICGCRLAVNRPDGQKQDDIHVLLMCRNEGRGPATGRSAEQSG